MHYVCMVHDCGLLRGTWVGVAGGQSKVLHGPLRLSGWDTIGIGSEITSWGNFWETFKPGALVSVCVLRASSPYRPTRHFEPNELSLSVSLSRLVGRDEGAKGQNELAR